MKNKTPYPMPVEIIRIIAKALDIKFSDKTLDDDAFNPNIPYSKIENIIEQLGGNLNKIDFSFEKKFVIHLKIFIKEYLTKFVATKNIPYSNRDYLYSILFPFVTFYFERFLLDIGLHKALIKKLKYLSDEENAISVTLEWIENNIKEYNFSSLTKENKDLIYSWRKEKHLPSYQSIQLLANKNSQIKQLLFIARVIDFFKKKYPYKPLFDNANLIKQQYINIDDLMKKIFIMFGYKPKTEKNKLECFKTIDKLRKEINNLENPYNFIFIVDWLEATWHIFDGNLATGYDFYKKSFENCLYQGKNIQKNIIEEALVVTVHQEKIDKSFLKNLRNAQITFGYDVPIQYKDTKNKNQHSNVIQDWQIELLKSKFHEKFPDDLLFEGNSYPKENYKTTPIVSNKIKPDYKHPSKQIKIGQWNKKTPQLIHFIAENEIDIVKKLLKKGADVNLVSESNETAIMIALEAANAFELKPPSTKLFNIISKYKHDIKTINIRTNKKKWLPIISAVETGRPEIVRKVLKMGANPNVLGSTDEKSALYCCIQCIHLLKQKDMKKRLEELSNGSLPELNTPEAIEAISRYTGGRKVSINSPEFLAIKDTFLEATYQNIKKFTDLDSFYEIIDLLLEFGADPNQEMIMPIKGCTPLMLSVKTDDIKLFENMMAKKGNIKKTFIFIDRFKKIHQIDCIGLATYYRATKILKAMGIG